MLRPREGGPRRIVASVDTEPGDDELRTFVASTLSDLGWLEPDVIYEAIREHRDMWVMLYRVSLGFEVDNS